MKMKTTLGRAAAMDVAVAVSAHQRVVDRSLGPKVDYIKKSDRSPNVLYNRGKLAW